MDDDYEVAIALISEIKERCGTVVAKCSGCHIQVQQKEKLELRAQCPFCGRFLTRLQ